MFIQGGNIRLTHWGRMIRHMVWRRVKASASAASHWVEGSDLTAPRTTSATLAMTGNAKPTVALIQSGKGIRRPNIVIWNGTRNITKNKRTSQGALRKICVSAQLTCRTGGQSDNSPSPRPSPKIVPSSMARAEIRMLKAKPVSKSGAHFAITCKTDGVTLPACADAVETRRARPTHRRTPEPAPSR